MQSAEERIKEALSIGLRYGSIDGAHHKQWTITEMIKALLGTKEAWIAWNLEQAGDPEDENNYYGDWDEGCPP